MRAAFVLVVWGLANPVVAQVLVYRVPDPLELAHLDAGSIYTDYVQAGRVDAGSMRTDLLEVGTVDAGLLWLQQARNPDGGRVYIPPGLDVDQGAAVGFRGPGSDAVIRHTGGALTLNAGAGLKVGTIDGFFTQTESTIGQLSPNALQCAGGATAATCAVVGGTAGPSPDAGLRLQAGTPDGIVTITNPSGLRTAQVGAVDGGIMSGTGYGWAPPTVTSLMPCDGVTVPYGTSFMYAGQEWQCNPIGQLLCGPGFYTYRSATPLPFKTRTLAEPLGSGSTAGKAFGLENDGTHFGALGAVTASITSVGACSGGCLPGTKAVAQILQRNRQDAGYRILAEVQLPCDAPAGFCSGFDRPFRALFDAGMPPATGCDTDAGAFNLALPVASGGLVSLEYKADGGLCSTFPVSDVTGWFLQCMAPDGGGA